MTPKYFFWIVFFVAFYGILRLYEPFLMNLIIAGLLCVASFGLKCKLDNFIKYNLFSSFFAVVIFLAIFIVPLVLVLGEILNEIKGVDLASLTSFVNDMKVKAIALLQNLPDSIKERAIELIKSINIAEGASYAVNLSASFGKAGLKFFIDLSFILIFLYLFYYYGKAIYEYVIDIIPLNREVSIEIIQESAGVLKVVFFTTIISMILQGLSFGIVVSVLEFSGVLFGVAYGLSSIVPLVGGALVWAPFCLYLYYIGEAKSAIFVALYSIIFIGFVIDNVIKPLIIGVVNKVMLKNPVQINEIIIFVAILAGLSSFGFWGIIIGPTLSAFFIALLRVYKVQRF